jgi:hypothetical protein
MDAVQNRVEILQRLREAAQNPDSISLDEAKQIYIQVHDEVYLLSSSPGIQIPKFWTKALDLAGVLLLQKEWRRIQETVRERLEKQNLSTGKNKTERNDNAY